MFRSSAFIPSAYSPARSPSSVTRCLTAAPGRLISTNAPRPSETSASLHATGPPPRGLVSPLAPALKGPSRLTDSTAGSTAAQFPTSDQKAHANSLPTVHSTVCVNSYSTGEPFCHGRRRLDINHLIFYLVRGCLIENY